MKQVMPLTVSFPIWLPPIAR